MKNTCRKQTGTGTNEWVLNFKKNIIRASKVQFQDIGAHQKQVCSGGLSPFTISLLTYSGGDLEIEGILKVIPCSRSKQSQRKHELKVLNL